MPESIEPEKLPKSASAESSPTHGDPADQENAGDDGPPVDPDLSTGFSEEQRRFMWTLTGVNIVAVLLAAAIVVGYLATGRSQDAAVVRDEDASQRATARFQMTEQRDMIRMIQAKLAGNAEEYNEFRQEVVEAHNAEIEALALYRRARGLPANDDTPEEIEQFTANLEATVDQNIARYKASTQPATKSATQPATKP